LRPGAVFEGYMYTSRPRASRCVRTLARALAGSALVLGCATPPADPDTDPSWVPLVLAEEWQPAPEDPMAHHADGDTITCGEQDWHAELAGLEIETTRCNYAAVEQPLLADLVQGDELRVRVWWQTLVSPAPVEGHLALFVGGELVWEEHVAIPGPAAAHDIELASPVSAAAGTPVTFHLHNHGSNTWNLNEFALQAPARARTQE
jgi:hypothetical protein